MPHDVDINRIRKINVKTKAPKSALGTYITNILLYSLIGISLLCLDFVLFASSGAINIFNGSSLLRPEVMYILIGIIFITFLLYFILSFMAILMNLLTAVIVFLTGIAIFNQFANFSTEALSSGKSEIVISFILAAVIFSAMFLLKKRYKAIITITAVFCFGAVLINQNKDRAEFQRVESDYIHIAEGETKNIITIMMPNAPSYSYIKTLKENEANVAYRDQLAAIMLGFYAKNGFKVYPNAYVTGGNSFLNAAEILNYNLTEDTPYLQTQVLKKSYWQFKNIEDFQVYLKENKMYDSLKDKGYKISAYQSHGINMCNTNDKNDVSRCVSKLNTPVNIANLDKLTTWDKTSILFAQWLESTGWFIYGPKTIYSYLKPLFNPNQMPVVGMSYKNLYVVDAPEVLDIAVTDIVNDKGTNAYFVMFDLPSDTYVYDELCQLKKSDLWLKKVNQPWVDNKNNIEKRNMYLRQTMCAFGKLEQFMQRLADSGALDNSTVIVQGLSGMDDAFNTINSNLWDTFRNENMVAMAIRAPQSDKFTISPSLCAVEDVLKIHLDGESSCEEFGRTTLSKTTKAELKKAIERVTFTGDLVQKSVRDYAAWYKKWNQINYQTSSNVSTDTPLAEINNSLPPMEEVRVDSMKVMSGQVQVGAEDKVIPMSGLGE